MRSRCFLFILLILHLMSSCHNSVQHAPATDTARKPVRLITLDPGHFHAALIQKSMYSDVDSNVYVYAPPGPRRPIPSRKDQRL